MKGIKMENVMKALQNAGLNPELENTGGCVMVAFLKAGKKIIGVAEYTLCIYDAEFEYESCVLDLDDDLEENARLDLLVKTAILHGAN
jgi:hypothetical protein